MESCTSYPLTVIATALTWIFAGVTVACATFIHQKTRSKQSW
jgi:hypothetical protein